MGINLNPHNCWFYERRDDEHCSQFQGCIHHFLSKVCEIMLISPSDFFIKTCILRRLNILGI